MAFYNCNGISSSGGNGGGISSLGKIEEYGYTLSEGKDVFRLITDVFQIVSMNDKYILYYAYVDGAYKYFKLDRENWSATEVTDIPKTVTYGDETYSIITNFNKPIYFDIHGDMILLYAAGDSNKNCVIYRYGDNIFSFITHFTYIGDYISRILDDYIYTKSNSSEYIYHRIGGEFSFHIAYSVDSDYSSNYIDDNNICTNVATNNNGPFCIIGKLYKRKFIYSYICGTNYDSSINGYKLSYYYRHYIYTNRQFYV